MTGYGLDWGSIPGRGKRFFATAQHPDRLWSKPSLISNEYRDIFFRVKAAEA
jgi:hypothetical protein